MTVSTGALTLMAPLPASGRATLAWQDCGLPSATQLAAVARRGAFAWLDITQSLAEDVPWAGRGHVVSHTQLPLGMPVPASLGRRLNAAVPAATLVRVTIDEHGATVKTDTFVLEVPRDAPGFRMTRPADSAVLIDTGGTHCFFRAPTDNDEGGGDSYAEAWRRARLGRLCQSGSSQFRAQQTSEAECVVTRRWRLQPCGVSGMPGVEVQERFTITATCVSLAVRVDADPALPPLPRVGLAFTMPASLGHSVSWLGRGPHENYADRCASAAVGQHHSSAANMHVPYIYPSECGGRSDVRWLACRSAVDGPGVLLASGVGSPPGQVNVSPYSVDQLAEAAHDYDLQEGPSLFVHWDHKHMGLGGDDSWSRSVHEEWLVRPPGPWEYSVCVAPLQAGQDADSAFRDAAAAQPAGAAPAAPVAAPSAAAVAAVTRAVDPVAIAAAMTAAMMRRGYSSAGAAAAASRARPSVDGGTAEAVRRAANLPPTRGLCDAATRVEHANLGTHVPSLSRTDL